MALPLTLPSSPSAPDNALARRYLMCPPTHFAVRYSINPWMRPGQPVDVTRANRQWRRLHDLLVQLGHSVELMPAEPDLPDLVFTANGGIVIGDRALVPRFRHAEREGESLCFAKAMAGLGIDVVRQARFINEGEGDFLLVGDHILGGTGLRSDPRAAGEVAEFFGRPVTALELIDRRFYHLDTALARLDPHTVVYWPGAFAPHSRHALRERFPDAILATEAEAALLGLNMVSDTETVIVAPGCDRLSAAIAERGYRVIPLAMDELRKAGGGAKCCVLELHP